MPCTIRSNSMDEEAAAAAVVEVADKTCSFFTEDDDDEKTHAYVGAAAQDAEAVADGKDAEAAAADSGDDGPKPKTAMSWTEYVVAYKRLSEPEIDFILSRPRETFESTDLYKDMVADSSTTKEDLEREAAIHESAEDCLSEVRERVRKEYAEKGFVAVDDDTIAERLELVQYFDQCVRDKLSELNLD